MLGAIQTQGGRRYLLSAVLLLGAATAGLTTQADTLMTVGQYQANPERMLEAYRHVEAASVSDAMEQVMHQKRYLSHRMQPIFPTKFAGTAVTVLLRKEENQDPHALDGMLQAIDTAGEGSVYVMQVEDGADIAGMGGLMGSAMAARAYAGAVIDGGVRDLPQLKRINFPVYALGAVPSTSVGHYRFGGANIPVRCDGIEVSAGDIVVADQDGVVIVPKASAAEILVKAQALDNAEHSMYPYIEKYHSIVEAVQKFGRI